MRWCISFLSHYDAGFWNKSYCCEVIIFIFISIICDIDNCTTISRYHVRDFSLMIQSIGMTSASFAILWMGVVIDLKTIVFSTCGGVLGIIFGLEFCSLDPPYAKMYSPIINWHLKLYRHQFPNHKN